MQNLPCINVSEYSGGVLSIDTGFMRDRMTSSYLVEAGSEVAFIETGPNSGVPRLLSVLEKRSWRPADVRYIIVTHVHLDHAGALLDAQRTVRVILRQRRRRHAQAHHADHESGKNNDASPHGFTP